MAKNRKKAEEYILEYIKKITRTDLNVNLYKDLFKDMNDKEFEAFMLKIKNGEHILQVIAPNDNTSTKIDLNNNFKIAEELNYEFFQYLNIGPTENDPIRKTKNKYLITLAPFRKMKQTITKGLSYAEHDKKRDILTGQVSGESLSSKISYPELQLMISMGLDNSIKELMKHRGGDEGSMRAIKQGLLKFGKVNGDFVDEYSTGVTSGKTLKAYFNSMHLKINI